MEHNRQGFRALLQSIIGTSLVVQEATEEGVIWLTKLLQKYSSRGAIPPNPSPLPPNHNIIHQCILLEYVYMHFAK